MPEIAALLNEDRQFPPSPEWKKSANISDPSVYGRAAADPEAFWADFAKELDWIQPWEQVLLWIPPYAQWFIGGKLNASANCLDRHVRTSRRNKAAIIWEGEPGDRRTLTYWDLYREVSAFANVLKSLGIKRGDRVAIYLPLIPELAIAMLACARIGAVHSVVFGGFSAEALRDRINDADASLLITADGGFRRGQIVPLKQMADEALRETPSIKHVVIVQRHPGTPMPVDVQEGRDHWYHRLMQHASRVCAPEPMNSEDNLYILYTSGTTGKPKGIVHTTAGYLVGTYATTKWVFDLKDDDVYWCTADIGWVTGHSYVVYGPLSNGATVVMYEGAPDWPQKDRFWELIERYGVTIFYTAPTAIRAFMRWGTGVAGETRSEHAAPSRIRRRTDQPRGLDLVSREHRTRTMSYRRHLVADRNGHDHDHAPAGPDQYEAGLGDASRFQGSASRFGTAMAMPCRTGGGLLAITKPWPSMLRAIYGDPERFVQQYWRRWADGVYFTGDGARRDDDGFYWLLGRVDDVLNVAGHRIGTMEVESALVDHPRVAEAAVVGRTHEIKGQAIAAFVTVKEGVQAGPGLADELKEHVVRKIGAIARPDQILFAADLPKTRSGKIMRRLLRDIAEGKALGDTTTLADPAVVERLKSEYEEKEG